MSNQEFEFYIHYLDDLLLDSGQSTAPNGWVFFRDGRNIGVPIDSLELDIKRVRSSRPLIPHADKLSLIISYSSSIEHDVCRADNIVLVCRRNTIVEEDTKIWVFLIKDGALVPEKNWQKHLDAYIANKKMTDAE